LNGNEQSEMTINHTIMRTEKKPFSLAKFVKISWSMCFVPKYSIARKLNEQYVMKMNVSAIYTAFLAFLGPRSSGFNLSYIG